MFWCFFFFSSRRRHTRWPRDWSSDVCSSDLRRADEEAGDRERDLALPPQEVPDADAEQDAPPEPDEEEGADHDEDRQNVREEVGHVTPPRGRPPRSARSACARRGPRRGSPRGRG